MLHTKLVTRTDVAQFKQISVTVHNDVFDSIVIDTQIQDVAPLLGEKLFNDILQNPTNYATLLNGGAYTYNNESYFNYGLKAVISYYFYARYIMFGQVTDTPFSLVEKLDKDGRSNQVPQRTKDALYTSNRDSAYTVWKSVENYLIRTENPLYNNNCSCETANTFTNSFKIKKII